MCNFIIILLLLCNNGGGCSNRCGAVCGRGSAGHGRYHGIDRECGCDDHEHYRRENDCGCDDHERYRRENDCGCDDHEHYRRDEACGCDDHEHYRRDEACGCDDHEHYRRDERRNARNECACSACEDSCDNASPIKGREDIWSPYLNTSQMRVTPASTGGK